MCTCSLARARAFVCVKRTVIACFWRFCYLLFFNCNFAGVVFKYFRIIFGAQCCKVYVLRTRESMSVLNFVCRYVCFTYLSLHGHVAVKNWIYICLVSVNGMQPDQWIFSSTFLSIHFLLFNKYYIFLFLSNVSI